jgi:hypothetical protein
LLCFAAALCIGFENHWSGLAWIPVAVLLFVAVVARVSVWVWVGVIRLRWWFVIIERYRLARKLSHFSARDRERLLARMSPEFREYFFKWIKSHEA